MVIDIHDDCILRGIDNVNNMNRTRHNIMKHFLLSLLIFIAPTIYSQNLQSIESYYTLCNAIGQESELKTQSMVVLLNGRLVEDNLNGPYGYIFFDNEDGEEDSILFFNKCNQMVIQKGEYSRMTDCLKKNNLLDGGETEQFKHLIRVRFFLFDLVGEKYKSYTASFPVTWFLNCQESLFFNTNIRITSLSGNNYLVSISTFGRYWSFHIEGDNQKRIKKLLTRKHKELYGQF